MKTVLAIILALPPTGVSAQWLGSEVFKPNGKPIYIMAVGTVPRAKSFSVVCEAGRSTTALVSNDPFPYKNDVVSMSVQFDRYAPKTVRLEKRSETVGEFDILTGPYLSEILQSEKVIFKYGETEAEFTIGGLAKNFREELKTHCGV